MNVSHPERVIFPSSAITKGEVVDHYRRVGAAMLAFLGGRPLTLERFPKGIEQKGFMQKNAGKHFPASIERFPVPKRNGDITEYPVVHHADDLAYLANQGTITFHMWTSTAAQPANPDWFVLDLDPDAEDLDGVRFATLAVGDLLEEFGLKGFVLATGSKGFHVWVRLDGSQTFDEVSMATRALAGIAATRHRDRLTTEFLKRDRAGRVFVDWLRNTGIATIVVPFSLRPRPTAPVAVPIAWHELAETRPDQWTLRDLGDRLDLAGPGTGLTTAAHRLPVDEIVATARTAGVDLDTPHDRFGRR